MVETTSMVNQGLSPNSSSVDFCPCDFRLVIVFEPPHLYLKNGHKNDLQGELQRLNDGQVCNSTWKIIST